MLRLACRACGRHGQYRTDRLSEALRSGRRIAGSPARARPLPIAYWQCGLAGAPQRGHRQLRENGRQVRRPGLDNSQGMEDRLRSTHLEMSSRVPRVDPADSRYCAFPLRGHRNMGISTVVRGSMVVTEITMASAF